MKLFQLLQRLFSIIQSLTKCKILLIFILFCVSIGCIEDHPETVRVTAGEWANFSCTINCSKTSLRWRLVSPVMEEINKCFYPAKRLAKEWEKKGITIQSVTEPSHSKDYESVTVRILASSRMNGAVIQCGAISFRGNISDLYSRFAVLQVELGPQAREERTTQESTGSEDTTRTTTVPPTTPPSH